MLMGAFQTVEVVRFLVLAKKVPSRPIIFNHDPVSTDHASR
jgi:hypothetical protein